MKQSEAAATKRSRKRRPHVPGKSPDAIIAAQAANVAAYERGEITPQMRASAQRVVSLKNNRERKKLPLFAADAPVVTVEQVFENRRRAFHATQQGRQEREAREAADIARYRAQLAALVSPAACARLEAKAESGRFGGRWGGWYFMLKRVEERAEPMPANSDLVLAWLQAWEREPPTHHELYQACADGLMTKPELLAALHWLERRELVAMGLGRKCRVADLFAATWHVPEGSYVGTV